MVKQARTIYVCRVCHRVAERPMTCHPGKSHKCDVGKPGDELTMPLFDAAGHLLTRAPKWWVEACFKSKVKSKK